VERSTNTSSGEHDAEVEELVSRLRRPERGENGHREGSESVSRLEALARLRRLAASGRVKRAGRAGGINTHVHTAKSFAYFASPAEAVWNAYLERIAVFGINDHYTLAGHEEFGAACRLLGIAPMFSLEAVAMWEEAEAAGATVNDPANPGRTYLTAKGVTRALPAGSRGAADLARMNAALLERNRAIAAKLAALLEERLGVKDALRWEDVIALTPHGQPTERHLCEAAARSIERLFPELEARGRAAAALVGAAVEPGAAGDPARLQEAIRAHLVKAGRPAYVPESRQAFLPVERLVSLALDLGAVPTYPVLLDPVTPWEADLDRLYDRIEALGIHAVEVIPERNTRERLRAAVEEAAARGLPILNGTEHNTKSPTPLVDRYFFDPEFRPHFERGARVILAHQARRRRGEDGYVREDGTLPDGDREERLRSLEDAGREVLLGG
jgi:hypothetical protein